MIGAEGEFLRAVGAEEGSLSDDGSETPRTLGSEVEANGVGVTRFSSDCSP